MSQDKFFPLFSVNRPSCRISPAMVTKRCPHTQTLNPRQTKSSNLTSDCDDTQDEECNSEAILPSKRCKRDRPDDGAKLARGRGCAVYGGAHVTRK